MTKLEFLKEAFNILGIPEETGGLHNKSILNIVQFGYRKAKVSAGAASSLTKKYFPNKPKNITIFNYLLKDFGCGVCSECSEVKFKEEFWTHKLKSSGTQPWCIECQKSKVYPTQRHYRAERRAAQLQQTPKWADKDKIKKIYNECPKGYHVDHIIPLRGRFVSGLHVETNLQYLTAEQNRQKGNKFL